MRTTLFMIGGRLLEEAIETAAGIGLDYAEIMDCESLFFAESIPSQIPATVVSDRYSVAAMNFPV